MSERLGALIRIALNLAAVIKGSQRRRAELGAAK